MQFRVPTSNTHTVACLQIIDDQNSDGRLSETTYLESLRKLILALSFLLWLTESYPTSTPGLALLGPEIFTNPVHMDVKRASRIGESSSTDLPMCLGAIV